MVTVARFVVDISLLFLFGMNQTLFGTIDIGIRMNEIGTSILLRLSNKETTSRTVIHSIQRTKERVGTVCR